MPFTLRPLAPAQLAQVTTSATHIPVQTSLNTSVSQIEVADLCLRKWWLQREAQLREAQKPYFIIGGRLHEVGERFLAGEPEIWKPGWDAGLAADAADWVKSQAQRAIQQGIWSVIPGARVEVPIILLVGRDLVDDRGLPLIAEAQTYLDETGETRIATPERLVDGSPLPAGWDALPYLIGFIDHYVPGSREIPLVADHKTSKNTTYGKKQEHITSGIQIPIYGAHALGIQHEFTAVTGRYNVFVKDPAARKPVYMVEDVVTIEQIRKTWRHVINQTEIMQAQRQLAPRVGGRKDRERAKNFWKVSCALDTWDGQGDCSACRSMGGCPYQALCKEQVDYQQMTSKMDLQLMRAEADAKRRPELASLGFGSSIETDNSAAYAAALALRNQPGPAAPARSGGFSARKNKDQTMPFGTPPPPTFDVGTDCYIADPDNASVYYKCRVIAKSETGVTVALYPHSDIEPDFARLPEAYRYNVPADALIFQTPHVVTDYFSAALAAGWPAEKLEYVKVRQEAPVTDDPYAGAAQATLQDQLTADQQPDPNTVAGDTIAAAEQMAEVPVEIQKTVESHQCWVGKQVHIDNALIHGSSFRGLCESVTVEGIQVQGFTKPITWDQIKMVVEMTSEATPGDAKDKKRVDQEKDLASLTPVTCLERIQSFFDARAEKESIGKRDFQKLQIYLARMKELVHEPTAHTVSATVTTDQAAVQSAITNAADNAYREGLEKGRQQGLEKAKEAIDGSFNVLLVSP